jgi:hypothetical protein
MSLLLALALAIGPRTDAPKSNKVFTVNDALVMITLDQVARAISARDPELLRPLLRPYGTFTVVDEKPDGTRSLTSGAWDAYLQRMKPGPEKYEERMYDVEIRVDRTVADVWAPYNFFLDGKLRHCGINHFQLVFEGGWKIQNVTWTQRMKGCAAR